MTEPSATGETAVPVSTFEALWLLRQLRAHRIAIQHDMAALEERFRHGSDHEKINMQAALLALNADLMVASALIGKLWKVCGFQTDRSLKT